MYNKNSLETTVIDFSRSARNIPHVCYSGIGSFPLSSILTYLAEQRIYQLQTDVGTMGAGAGGRKLEGMIAKNGGPLVFWCLINTSIVICHQSFLFFLTSHSDELGYKIS